MDGLKTSFPIPTNPETLYIGKVTKGPNPLYRQQGITEKLFKGSGNASEDLGLPFIVVDSFSLTIFRVFPQFHSGGVWKEDK
jgi:predicted acetyltransferase